MVFERTDPAAFFCGYRQEGGAGFERGGHAVGHSRTLRSGGVGDRHLQPGLFWAAVVVHVGYGVAHGSVSVQRCRFGGWPGRVRRRNGGDRLWRDRRLLTRPWIWLSRGV